MKTHELTQGTPEWHAYRAEHFNASDAPAMMGVSTYKTRTQLLHELHTGRTGTVDAATQRIFDAGHRFEALARPLAEEIIGESLYPVVGSDGELSASFDGLTVADDIGFEHKTLNDALRAAIRQQGGNANEFLAPMYRIQMEQQLLISGAERILFMASKWDGDNLVEERHCWYTPDLELRAQIVSGWEQFGKDLAAFVPQEVTVAPVAAPQMNLPAVSIQVTGSIALVDNLEKFGTALTAYIANLNRQPETDQDFANLEDAVKRLKAAEDQLDAAESSALGQTESINDMRRTVALHRDTARSTRLLIDKLVKAEKENRRTKILSDAVSALHAHMKGLQERTRNYMPTVPNQFQDVIKGLKSLDSMKDKLASELARCKIEANAIADKIQFNLALLDDNTEFGFLFPDAAQVVLKAADDFTALVNSRIAAHKAEAARKEEETRARIQAEEQAKAEKAAREKLAAEQAATAAAEKLAKDQAEAATRASVVMSDKAAADTITTRDGLLYRNEAIIELPEADQVARAHGYGCAEQFVKALAPVVDAEVVAAPALTHTQVVQQMPATVRQAMALAPTRSATPTMTLGTISERLGVNVTSAFLATLGFEATVVKAARLFHEEDFSAICEALKTHISEVQEQFEAVAA